MSMSPRVSFILPIFNAGRYLAQTLDSLCQQTFADFEIIAINDGSTDATPKILRAAAATDSRLRVIERENRGLVATLNEAVGLARGRYLARVDADDLCLPHRLAVQVEYLDARPEIAVIGSAIETFSDEAPSASNTIYYPSDPAPAILFRNALAHPSVMMRKSVLDAEKLRYRDPYRCAQDYDLWCRCIARGIKINNLPDVLLKYRLHAGQITHEFAEPTQLEGEAIRGEFLHELGLSPTAADLRLHNSIARDQLLAEQPYLNAAAAWLVRLATERQMRVHFEHTGLLRVLTGRYVALTRFARTHHLALAGDAASVFAEYIRPDAFD